MGFWQRSSSEKTNESVAKRCAKKQFPLWLLGVCVGVAFIGIGVYQEQFTDIYRKAVMICLECIGIG